MEQAKKKILIITFRSGFGHLRSAQALQDYAEKFLPGVATEQCDVAQMHGLLRLHAWAYEFAVKNAPFLWNATYKQPIFFLSLRAEAFLMGFFNRKLRNYLQEKSPDIIIFTNILISPVFVGAIKKLRHRPLVAAVMTDYHAHAYYNLPFIDCYFMPTQEVADDFEKLGMRAANMVVAGIPIDPKFYAVESKESLQVKYGVDQTMPAVLLIASFRISENECRRLVKKILDQKPAATLMFIANGNKMLFEAMQKNFASENRLLLVNWTNAIEEYITMADVVITKAGGLTTTECLTLGKKMIIFRPIPGQEEYNAVFIEKHGFGVTVSSIDELAGAIPAMIGRSNEKSADAIPAGNPSKIILETVLAKVSSTK